MTEIQERVENNLPSSWALVSIGNISKTTSGGTPSRKHQEYYSGDIPWIKSGELNDGFVSDFDEKITELGLKKSSAKIFPKGTPLVALYGATVGKTGILNIDAATNQAICALFPKGNSFIAKYMQYYLRSERDNLIVKSVGGAQPNISQTIIKAYPFPLAPLSEQKRIVAKIEELFTQLDAGVAALKRAQANLKRYKASVLKAACDGRLVPTEAELNPDDYEPASVLLERILKERREKWEANLIAEGKDPSKRKYKEPAQPDVENLPELPEGWVWVTFEALVNFKNGINFSKEQKGNEGYPTMDVLNMYSEGIALDLSNIYKVNKQIKEDYLLRNGDILFVRSSVKREGVGWASMFTEANEPTTYCGFIIRARLVSKNVTPEYITYFMRSAFARERLIGSSSQVTITNINQKA